MAEHMSKQLEYQGTPVKLRACFCMMKPRGVIESLSQTPKSYWQSNIEKKDCQGYYFDWCWAGLMPEVQQGKNDLVTDSFFRA
jgi:hypothetical protein